MLGSGSVRTSSPTWPTTGWPCSSKLSTLAPRARHWISPGWTGSSGQEVTNEVQTSVPPLVEPTSTSGATCSYSQAKPSGGRGEPVEPIECSADRSASRAGVTPAFMLASTKAALVPR